MVQEEQINERVEVQNDPTQGAELDPISALNEMRKNTVPKSDHEKLKQDNARLLGIVMRGETIEGPKQEESVDLNQLRKDLFFNENIDNLEYAKKTLQLRKAVIDQGGMDPFLPVGERIRPTAQDVEAAERVARVFEECIEYADGNSEIFTQELMRRTIDSPGGYSFRNKR